MLVGFLVSLIIFLDLPDIKDALVSEGIIWAEVQYGDCYSQATTQTETGSGQTGLVFAPSWYPTFEFLEIATDLPSAQCPSVKCLSSIALAMTTVNRDPRKCRVCKQLRTSSVMYCSTCHQPWQNVIDQSYCSRLEEVAAERPRSVLPDSMAGTTRLASALAIDFGSWPGSFATPEAKTKKCQGEQDAQESTAGCTTDATYDDASHATQCIPWTSSTSSTDASNVSSANDAVPCMLGTLPPLPPPDIPWHQQQAQNMAKMPAPMPAPPGTTTTPPMPTMPAPAMPKMPAGPARLATKADEEVRGLMSMVRGRQAELPQDMQQKVQKVLTKYGQQTSTDLHAAVTALDNARHNYDEAVLARSQHSSSQTQCNFGRTMDQEKKLQEQVNTHKESLIAAKRDLEKSKVAKLGSGEVQNITSDEETEDQEASNATNAATKITETMEGLVQSLDSLHKEAEAMVAEEAHVAKRHRTMQPKEEDQNMDAVHPSGPPFGKAG